VTVLSLVAYKEKMFRASVYGAVLLASAGFLAACGASGHFTPAQRAAITAAQRKNNILRIFPDRPGSTSCRIPAGGPVAGGYFPGHCSTSVSSTAQRIRLDFSERFSPGRSGSAGFTVILDKQNRIVGQSWAGSPPQMRN
jgi:hypothetical protein